MSSDRVGRRRRLVAESDRSAHLDGIDEHFSASHRGRKYSADERKPELRVLCSVSGVETRGVRESGPSREGLFIAGGSGTRVSYSSRLVVRSMVISTANLAVSSYPSPPDIFV